MSTFNFDSPTDRSGTHSLRWEKYKGRDVIPLWVADTDFRAPPAVIDALRRRVEQGIFGYTSPPLELRELIVAARSAHPFAGAGVLPPLSRRAERPAALDQCPHEARGRPVGLG